MTSLNANTSGGGLGPAVEIWIEDTPGGQALFVTTTTSDGTQATSALWQPMTTDDQTNEDPHVH